MIQNQKTPRPARISSWSPERRAKQAASIKIWAPWAKSTGPKTKAGNRVSSRNARKHNAHRVMKTALSAQARYLAEIKRYFAARKILGQNELLKKHRRFLLRRGRKVTAQLAAALLYAKLCKNLAFSPPFPLKVNEMTSSRRLDTPKAGVTATELK